MWVPRATDVARIAAVLRACGDHIVDVGAGTGLLASLLDQAGVKVEAVDPAPPGTTYVPVEQRSAEDLTTPRDAVIVGWMEAGVDYREAVARLAPVLVNIYDVEGGCGVMGATDFAPYGFVRAASWRTPSFEDAEYAVDRPGRGMQRRGAPGNRVDILTTDPTRVAALRHAVDHLDEQDAVTALPWEAEMDAAGL